MMNHPADTKPEYKASSSELLCVSFLDTDTTKDKKMADEELRRRGYSSWLIRVLRSIFSVGLWTQGFTWEEWHLDLNDVLAGYGLLLSGLGVIVTVSALVTKLFSWHIGAYVLLTGACLLALAIGGWLARRRNHVQGN
jgi:hypothetical protein